MRLIVLQRKIFKLEVKDVFYRGVEFHKRERVWFAGELQLCLFDVIAVYVDVAESMDEFAGFQIADLGDHEREQGIRSDVEGYAEEYICAALIELTA